MKPEQQEVLIKVERNLMAPCCYTQTIDVHMSDVARDMRRDVANMILEGQTARQIFNHYKAIYGEVILAVPDGKTEIAAFAIPIATSSLATSGLLYFLYRMHKRKVALTAHSVTIGAPSEALDDDEVKQILQRVRHDTAW